jgi:acetamidase/formamidase
MNSVIAVDLIKGRPCPWPRIESETHIISTGSARPLEDAFRIAQSDLVHWLGEDYGLEAMDAYQLVSQGVLAPLANVVDTNYTSVAKFPKKFLPDSEAMGGADARLRSLAADYLRMHP